MRIILCDSRKLDASKDFAGGYGVGLFPGGPGLRAKVIRRFYTRDRRPTPLVWAYLAGAMKELGHQVRYAVDRLPRGADLYIFCPSLITLAVERQIIARLLQRQPAARVLVVGPMASVMPSAFDGLDVTIVKGEPEQLRFKLDEVLDQPQATVNLGILDDLDRLPMPDWSPLRPQRFRIGYDFTRFPTGLIQASRGCPLKCNYCPYIALDNSVRFRDPALVAEEMRLGIERFGFRSMKFRDPLFGANRKQLYELAERIGRLPRKIQFSIETRIDAMRPETLRLLRRVGLTSVTVGIETPHDETLARYRRAPIELDRQRQFIDTCRELGIRTVAGFMIGFPEDTDASIRRVLEYAKQVNPTFANFNVVTPYPGTPFFQQMRDRIADFDYSHYTVYTPVLRYDHLTAERVGWWLRKCFERYYFRWDYLRENAALLWPGLRRLGLGAARHASESPEASSRQDTPHQPSAPRPTLPLKVLEDKGLRHDGPHRRPTIDRPNDVRRT